MTATSDNSRITLLRIVSGGQTGADRGVLDAAIESGVKHGGWCPKGRLAEDGIIDARYLLRETASSHYAARTLLNVKDSDATVVFSFGRPAGGSAYTIAMAKQFGKNWLHVDLACPDMERSSCLVFDWLTLLMRSSQAPTTFVLNVAGSRESQAKGIGETVKKIMTHVLELLRQ